MNTVLRSLSLVIILFCFAATGCNESGDPAKVTNVVEISIDGRDLGDLHKPLIVNYSAEMVAKDAVGKDVTDPAAMPFKLEPAVSGKGYWSSTTSFTFQPENGYAAGTRYFVVFKEGLKDLAGNPARFYYSFATRANTLKNFQAGSFDSAKNSMDLSLDFEQAVTTAQLKEHLSLFDFQTGEALKVDIPADMRSRHWTVNVNLGKYRPMVALRVTKDAANDPAPLGLKYETSANIRLPEPATRAAGGDDRPEVVVDAKSQPSEVSINYGYDYDEGDGRMQAVVYLSRSVADQDFTGVITSEPPLPFTVSGSRIQFSENVEPQSTIKVKLLPGLVDGSGRVLREEREYVVSVGDRNARASFSEQGSLLTPAHGGRVGVNLVNVDKVVLSLRRVYDNNLPLIGFENELSGFDPAKKIIVKEVQISGERNEILRRSIDPAALAEGRCGVYLLSLEGYHKSDDGDYFYHAGSEERVVVLSDIGLTARVFPSGLTVFAAGLSTGKPMPGVAVKVYSASNQPLCEGATNADGLFVHKRDAAWEEDLMPHIVTAVAGNDVTFLPMKESTGLTLTAEGTRDYLDKGYEAFVYTPRGVFRPGEIVDLKAFVRSADHSAPKPFPVMFAITSSRGLETARGSAELSEYGAVDFRFELPRSAPTGTYTANVFVPGKEKEPLGSVTFSVEDFVPPRLEVGVAPAKTVLVGRESMKVALSGRYLFGAPGAERPYELGWKVTPVDFTPKGYEGWSFKDLERPADSQTSLRYLTGALDGEGKAEVDFTAPSDWLPPSIFRVMLIAGVQEDGGRWTTKTETLTWFPQPYLLGLNVPAGDKDPGKAVPIKIAALTPDERPAEPGALTVELYRLRSYWSTVYREGRTAYVWNERKTREGRWTVEAANGKAEVEVKPGDYGTYLVRCLDAEGKVTASQRFDVWGSYGTPPSDDGAGRLDQIELTFDKPGGYKPGETAKVSIKAPFAGTLLLGVERSEQLSTRVVPMSAPSVQVEIPVDAGMTPNVTVTAWVYRPVEKAEKNWFAHRAFGSGTLRLSPEARELKVEAVLPDRAKPSESVRIPFKVADSQGKPVQGEFSVALIDEGILSLTTFSTPNPKDFFLALRRAVGLSSDAYDRLLKPEATASAPLIPGGDGSADYQGSLSTQQVFLTSYLPKVVTGPDGSAEAVFDLPDYSGKGRLMIVGASHSAFASKAEALRITRDVTLEVTAPRAVAPGDTFEIPLDVFSADGAASGTAGITVTSEGPISLSGDVKGQATLGAAKPAKLVVKGEALKEAGVAAITASVTVPGREDLSFSRRVEVVVRPPFPRTSAVASALVKEGEEQNITLPGGWMKGGFALAFSVDSSPVLSILPALEYLREYPYGCLEQTTSRAWPYLTLETVQKSLAKTDSKGIENNAKKALQTAVDRISSMQTASGGFAMWPGGGNPRPWLSVNAAHILVEAKSRIPVNRNTLDRALSYLEYLLGAPEESFDDAGRAYTTKAYAAFVLTRAGKAPLSRLQTLSEQTGKMLPSGRIFLAAAKSLAAGNSKALDALKPKDLTYNAKDDYWNATLESPMRNAALELMAWSLVDPRNNRTLETAVRLADLVNGRRWFTTQEAGMASLAVGLFLEKTATGQEGFTASVQVGDAAPETVSQRRIFGNDELPAGADGAPAAVRVKADKGAAYCIYSVRGVPLQEPQRPENTGLTVEREWQDADGNALDPSKEPLKLKQGDRIVVTIKVTAGVPTPDVVLSDLTPGGMEVENPRLESAAKGDDEESDGESEGGASDIHLDLREDRVLVFFDRVDGTVTYKYSMRAVNKGAFVVPPTAAEGMYNPERNDIAPSGVVIVE